MPSGLSGCSIAAEAPWRLNRLEFGEVEIDNCPQGIGGGAVLLIIGQCLQPCGIFRLEIGEGGDGIVPALDPATPVP